MKFRPFLVHALTLAVFGSALSCHVHRDPATAPLADNDFLDLAGGGSLRVTVPKGHSSMQTQGEAKPGSAIELKADGPVGFEVSHYSIVRAAGGRVRLRFQSAETHMDGKTIAGKEAPRLPFSLPTGAQFIRLIYFVRSSQADHNMAIAASLSLADLQRFTDQLKKGPAICGESGTVACAWVPAGVAIRPE